jgi:hypothetical protein
MKHVYNFPITFDTNNSLEIQELVLQM